MQKIFTKADLDKKNARMSKINKSLRKECKRLQEKYKGDKHNKSVCRTKILDFMETNANNRNTKNIKLYEFRKFVSL